MESRTTNQNQPRGPHYRRALPKVQLEIIRGRARNSIREINVPVFLIGTADDCDMVLGDPRFPEVHTYIYVTDDGVSLRHLGMDPDLTVNGRPARALKLQDGDVVRTGSYEFRIIIDHVSSPEPRERRQAADIVLDQDVIEAMHHVETLLNQIRSALVPGTHRLRIYIEPEQKEPGEETEPDGASHRASA